MTSMFMRVNARCAHQLRPPLVAAVSERMRTPHGGRCDVGRATARRTDRHSHPPAGRQLRWPSRVAFSLHASADVFRPCVFSGITSSPTKLELRLMAAADRSERANRFEQRLGVSSNDCYSVTHLQGFLEQQPTDSSSRRHNRQVHRRQRRNSAACSVAHSLNVNARRPRIC